MTDLYGSDKTGKWRQEDAFAIFVIIIIGIFLTVFISIFLIISPSDLLGLFVALYGVIMLLFMMTFIVSTSLQRKGMYIKIFNYDNNSTIKVIQNMLQNSKIQYLKKSKGNYIKKFPLKYAEIFELSEYQIEIRVLKQSIRGSLIEVGPKKPDNQHRIDHILNIIDSAFQPIGLNQ